MARRSLKEDLYEHCTRDFIACKQLITMEIMVEGRAVERIRVLILRKLLIL
jgi:hypothetical protein